MKTQLDEAKIRRLVRESITRRMLSEARGTADGASLGGFLNQQFGLGGGSGDASSDTPSEPLPGTFTSGRKRGESAAQGIASLVGGAADIDPGTGLKTVGDELGASVKTFIDGMKYINAPFKVSDASSVMAEWNSAYKDVPALKEIGPDGKPTAKNLEPMAGEEGLLRYLIALKNAETGLELTLEAFSNMDSDYNQNLAPLVAEFITIIDGPTSLPQLEYIASKTAEVIKADTLDGLFRTKILLAGFSRDNSTTYELLKPIGIVAGIAAIAIATWGVGALIAASTGGAALITSATGAALTGATMIGATATTGVILVGAAAMTYASVVVGLWGVTTVCQSVVNNYIKGPIGDALNAVNQPGGSSYLDELSVEVGRTYFPLDDMAEYRRDQIASGLSMITDLSPNKSEIINILVAHSKKPNKNEILDDMGGL